MKADDLDIVGKFSCLNKLFRNMNNLVIMGVLSCMARYMDIGGVFSF